MKIGNKVVDTFRTKKEIFNYYQRYLSDKSELIENLKRYPELQKITDTSKWLSKEEMFNLSYIEGSEICIITDMTVNSVEVQHFARTIKGIDCKNWYTLDDFNKRFK